jgi:hypothetical protein
MKKSPSWLTPIAFLVLTIGILGGGYALLNQTEDVTTTEQHEIASDQWTQEGEYYTTTWEYPISEGRTGTVGFKVMLDENNAIANADLEILTTNEESMAYQEDFRAEVNQVVVGKKLSELTDIDTIAGASSTTNHFKEAVAVLDDELKS